MSKARCIAKAVANNARSQNRQKLVDRIQAQDEAELPSQYGGYDTELGHRIKRLGGEPIATGTTVTNGGIAIGQAVDLMRSAGLLAIDSMPRVKVDQVSEEVRESIGRFALLSFGIAFNDGVTGVGSAGKRWRQSDQYPSFPIQFADRLLGRTEFNNQEIRGLIQSGNLLVMTGVQSLLNTRSTAYLPICYSLDGGRVWSASEQIDPFGIVSPINSANPRMSNPLSGCLATPEELIAVASGSPAPSAEVFNGLYRSVDGVSWEFSPSSVIRESRVILVNQAQLLSIRRDRFLVSNDFGRNWQPLNGLPDWLNFNYFLAGVAQSQGRLALVWISSDPAVFIEGFPMIHVMVSDDLQSWESRPLDPYFFSGRFDFIDRYGGIAGGRSGFVACGSFTTQVADRPLILFSPDGLDWQEATPSGLSRYDPVSYDNGRFSSVAYSSQANCFLTRNRDNGFFASSNGQSWSQPFKPVNVAPNPEPTPHDPTLVNYNGLLFGLL